MRISDWSSDVCSSDLVLQAADLRPVVLPDFRAFLENRHPRESGDDGAGFAVAVAPLDDGFALDAAAAGGIPFAILTERQLFHERASQPRRRRSAARRVGNECVSKCRSRWSPEPLNNITPTNHHSP